MGVAKTGIPGEALGLVGWVRSGGAGEVDSKNERSAFAQASWSVSCGVVLGAGVFGFSGRGAGVLEGIAGNALVSAGAKAGSRWGVFTVLLPTGSACLLCGLCIILASVGGVDSGFVGSLSNVKGSGRLTGFKIPGPIGPCSAPRGTKDFVLKMAEVGEIVPFRRVMCEACMASADCLCAEKDRLGGGVAGRAGITSLGSIACEIEVRVSGSGSVGLPTISPHSSSSSTAAAAASFFVATFVSMLLKLFQCSRKVGSAGVMDCEAMGLATPDVSEGRFETCSRIPKSGNAIFCETAWLSCPRLLDVTGLAARGEDVDRNAGLSSPQGSAAAAELQLKAAGASVATGGRLCLAGMTARGVGTDVFVRE